jgi:hypothetical protein
MHGGRQRFIAVVAAAAALALAACSSISRSLPGYRRAVVIYAPSRLGDAEKARALLVSDGWSADIVAQGPAQRTRTSLSVYDAHHYPRMPAHLQDVLKPLGGETLEVLPFPQPGPGGTSAVLYLAD